jgi:hypothetical protein
MLKKIATESIILETVNQQFTTQFSSFIGLVASKYKFVKQQYDLWRTNKRHGYSEGG